MLEAAGVDAVYAPADPWEMYPQWPPFRSYVTPEGSSDANEGAVRPHFFRGVATVVTKLFNVLPCQEAYFGAKDAYQCIVVKQLLRDLHLPNPHRVHIVPTQRLECGLAASSRNVYLTPQQRDIAPALMAVMQQTAQWMEATMAAHARDTPLTSLECANIVQQCTAALQGVAAGLAPPGGTPPFSVEYISIMDATSGIDISKGDMTAMLKSAAYLQHRVEDPCAQDRMQEGAPQDHLQGGLHLKDALTWAPGDGIPHIVPRHAGATYAERFVYAPPPQGPTYDGQPPLVLSGAIRMTAAPGAPKSMVRLLDNIVVFGSEQSLGGP